MSSSLNKQAVFWSIFLLVAGAWVVTGCGSSGSADVMPAPGMLYFYAEW